MPDTTKHIWPHNNLIDMEEVIRNENFWLLTSCFGNFQKKSIVMT